MTSEFHHVMGLIALAVMVIGKAPYILSILRGITKPSRTSWWIWTLLGSISFVTYLFSGETGTLWVTGFLVVGPLIIAVLSIRYGDGGSSRLDRMIWIGCLLAMLVWAFSGSASTAHYVNLIIDTMATVPTVRKAWLRPDSEDLTAWVLSLLGYSLNLLAIEYWTPFSALYPIYLWMMAAAIIVAVLLGRRRLRKESPPDHFT